MSKKLKTHKGAAKRFKITANKKVIGNHAGDKHFNQKKSGSRKRNSALRSLVIGSIAKNIKRALGV